MKDVGASLVPIPGGAARQPKPSASIKAVHEYIDIYAYIYIYIYVCVCVCVCIEI